ncbi:MAG: RNA polymerase sigma factor [bacterium]|nr:RNA polymerase sigma factor [bacterium]
MQDQPQNPQIDALLANAAWVQRLARKLVSDAHQADDLTQDVLAAALDQPPTFASNREHLRKWLGGITRHLASRHRRREGERGSRESAAADHGRDPEGNPTERFELHAKLVKGVLSLGAPYQTTVILHFFDGLSIRDISKRQNVPEGTVRQRLSRALSKLREQLDADFDGHRRQWCLALATLYPTPSSVAPLITKAIVAAVFVALLGILGFRALQGESKVEDAEQTTLVALAPETEQVAEFAPPRDFKPAP